MAKMDLAPMKSGLAKATQKLKMTSSKALRDLKDHKVRRVRMG